VNLSPNERQSTESRAVAEAWRAAVHDEMRAELHRRSDELNDGLARFKAESEERRTARTSQLVEAQQRVRVADATAGEAIHSQ